MFAVSSFFNLVSDSSDKDIKLSKTDKIISFLFHVSRESRVFFLSQRSQRSQSKLCNVFPFVKQCVSLRETKCFLYWNKVFSLEKQSVSPCETHRIICFVFPKPLFCLLFPWFYIILLSAVNCNAENDHFHQNTIIFFVNIKLIFDWYYYNKV